MNIENTPPERPDYALSIGSRPRRWPQHLKTMYESVKTFVITSLKIVWAITRLIMFIIVYVSRFAYRSFMGLPLHYRTFVYGAACTIAIMTMSNMVSPNTAGEPDSATHKTATSGFQMMPKAIATAFPEGYNDPRDLFYVFLKSDRTSVSQTPKQHFTRNGYLATDIATNDRKIDIHAPSYDYLSPDGQYKDEERTYIVKLVHNYDTMGQTIELHWSEGGVPYNWAIGHVNQFKVTDGQTVKTGDVIGLSGGCPGELKEGEVSTGCHAHVELRVGGRVTAYPIYQYSNHGEDLKRFREFKATAVAGEKRVKEGVSLAGNDDVYKKAAESFPVETPFLEQAISAIHNAENGRCSQKCDASYIARGPMQFTKKTWEAYACDASGDKIADVENLQDSICTASNYLGQLYKNERSQSPNDPAEWIWWRASYRYNAGYQTKATHKDGIPSAVAYADGVVNVMKSMGAFK